MIANRCFGQQCVTCAEELGAALLQLVPALALALICAATAAGRDRAAAASLRAAPIDIFGAAETTQLLQTTTTRDTVMAPHARLWLCGRGAKGKRSCSCSQ